MNLRSWKLDFLLGCCLLFATPCLPVLADTYFHIQVVDQETKQGIPLVELKTVNGIRLVTDSAGNIAFDEVDLMNQDIFFHISSHGYTFRKDGFGYRGIRLKTIPGKKALIKLKRTNLAQRLYRITGTGIYHHTRKLGLKPPIPTPSINAKVLGSDSVVNAIYQEKLYWFWGDTNRTSYPLGNFQVSGAVSDHPSKTDPDKGIKLEYFKNNNRFTKQMAPIAGKGPTWIFGVFVTRDKSGAKKLIAKYEKIKPPLSAYQRGLVIFDDDKKLFQKLTEFDLESPNYPAGQSLVHKEKNGKEFVYFATPFPFTRVENQIDKIKDSGNYETYTYFKTGVRVPKDRQGNLQPTPEMFDRDSNKQLVVSWKKNAQPISPRIEQSLVNRKLVERRETITLLRNPDGKELAKKLMLASGSVAWNDYRKKWIMIAVQSWGSSMLGEIWYAESNTLEGPWNNAKKVATHNDYSFYNPRHHPYFDKDGGRTIFFEGTYTKMFSGTKVGTPRYDYNQIMYKLDLSKIEFSSQQ